MPKTENKKRAIKDFTAKRRLNMELLRNNAILQ